MGFFSNIFGGESGPTSFAPHEAFTAILLAVIGADGYISDDEVDDFFATLRRAKIMTDVNQNKYKEMMNKLMRILKSDGCEKLVDIGAEFLPAEYRQGTFAYACELVFSDGVAHPDEQKILDRIKNAMQIDDALAYKVAEVLILKNKV
jgi:uncharacterized tellurite resistance protein B-like protein